MAMSAGRGEGGREAQGSDRPADALGSARDLEGEPAFSDAGARRIVYAQDRDRRSETFNEDTAELEADLAGRRRVVPLVIALAAVICFGAVVWYAYSWGTGQVAEDSLPVVQAEDGPEKTRPEQPGGLEVPHQDKLVLNEGTPAGEGPRVERLLPPPETPQPIEPLPVIPAPPLPSASTDQSAEAPPAAPESAGDSGTTVAIPEVPAEAIPAVPAEEPAAPQLEIVEAPESGEVPLPNVVDGVTLPQLKPSPPAGTATSSEPAGGEDQIANLLSSEPLQTANGHSAAAPLGPQAGDIVLQLSSVTSEAAAAREWARLQAAHPGLLGGRDLSLDRAEVRGTTYYRVQTGPFASRGAATEICGQLKSRNQDCLVKQR